MFYSNGKSELSFISTPTVFRLENVRISEYDDFVDNIDIVFDCELSKRVSSKFFKIYHRHFILKRLIFATIVILNNLFNIKS